MPSRKDSPNRSETFGRLLSGAINSIATYEGRTAPAVEEELGQLLTRSGKTIQRYKAGHLPPEDRTVEVLADAAIRRGYLGREWLQRFLHAARYPFADKLLDRLCPIGPVRPRPPRVYHSLPAPTYSQFVMRAQAFAEVIDGLQQRSAVVLIVGLGGNGKTSLAREVAARCLQDVAGVPRFDAVVWISDKDRPGTTNLSVVLDEIARTLDYPGLTQFAHDEKLYEVGQLLRRQRVLVVVDNFETITDGALLMWLLRLPEPSKAIVTSREYGREYRRGGWPVELRGMSEGEAREFVDQRLRVLRIERLVSDPVHLEPLLAATGGNPKAIEIALGLVKHERRPLQQIVDDLYAARGELFDDLFTRAWALLDQAAQHVLLAMTFFPASANDKALPATADVHGFAFDHAVERLTDLALLDVQQEDLRSESRYAVHPLVRAFATTRLCRVIGFAEQASVRWSQHFLDFARQHLERSKSKERYWCCLANRSMNLIDPEWSNLQSVLEWADRNGRHRTLVELMMLLVHYMDLCGLYTQRIYYAQKAAEAAEALGQTADAALFRIDGLGWTLTEEGRFEEAEQEIRAGLLRAEALGLESAEGKNLTALAYAFLARLHLNQGDIKEAQAWIAKGQHIDCQRVIRHRVVTAAGDIAHTVGNYQAAISFFNEAVCLEKAFRGEEAVRYDLSQRLGFAYLDQGDWQEAKCVFNDLLALRGQVGAMETVYAKYGLARVALEEGDKGRAYQLAQEALDTVSRLKIRHRLINQIENFLSGLNAPGMQDVNT